jgi:hypothetical protein
MPFDVAVAVIAVAVTIRAIRAIRGGKSRLPFAVAQRRINWYDHHLEILILELDGLKDRIDNLSARIIAIRDSL